MLMRTIVLQTSLVALIIGVVVSATGAEETVDLKAKFPPGRTSFVESESEVQAISTSPMGGFEMTLRTKNGVIRKVTSRGNGTTLSLTIDRAALILNQSHSSPCRSDRKQRLPHP